LEAEANEKKLAEGEVKVKEKKRMRGRNKIKKKLARKKKNVIDDNVLKLREARDVEKAERAKESNPEQANETKVDQPSALKRFFK
jgi:hypothetical protein